MHFCSVMPRDWETYLKTTVGILTLLTTVFILPMPVEAVTQQKTAVIRASDGHVYEVQYTQPLSIENFTIHGLEGEIPSREIAAELYLAASILNRPPTASDIYQGDELVDWVHSETEHTSRWKGYHQLATIVGSVSASALVSAVTGAIEITVGLIQTEAVQQALQVLTTITLLVGEEKVMSEAYITAWTFAERAVSNRRIFDGLVLVAESGTEVSIADIKWAYNALLQADRYVKSVHWLMQEYLILPDRWERLWAFAKSVFPLSALGQFFASAGENIEDLRNVRTVFHERGSQIETEISANVAIYFGQDVKDRIISALTSEGFFDREPPTIERPIEDLQLMMGDGSRLFDLGTIFNDPNGDELEHSVEVTNGNVADAELVLFRPDGELFFKPFLEITPKSIGTTTVTIEARDPTGFSVEETFTVTVEPAEAPNQPPVAVNRILPQSLTMGSASPPIDVSVYFHDLDGGTIFYTAVSSNPAVATIQRIGSEITILPQGIGTATITVTAANSEGPSATQTFTATVTEAPPQTQPPKPLGKIPNQTLAESGTSKPIDVSAYFSDPEDDTLTYTASTDTPSVVKLEWENSSLTITAKIVGTAAVTVRATDSDDLHAIQRFTVRVTIPDTPPPNRAPQVSHPIPARTLTVGNSAALLSVSGYFNDPDGDTLTYTSRTSHTSVVTVSPSGSPVLITPVAAGTATITVAASDGELTATQSFTVTVTGSAQQNQAPIVVNRINPQNFRVGDEPKWRNLSSYYFSDPDNDTLTYTATSSNRRIAAVSLSGNSVKIMPGAPGSATITVTASDGELTATQSFRVTVQAQLQTIPSLPVCDRTPQVRDEIMKRTRDNNCANVTEDELESIRRLSIINKGLMTLKQGDFDELRNLEELTLNENSLRTLPEDVFWYLGRLEALSLGDNQFTTLVADTFEHLDSLTDLTLQGNQLTTLQQGAFDDLEMLIELDLSDNHLTTLPSGVFEELSSLEELSLENNRIAILSRGGFLGLSSLEDLYLDENPLQTIEAGAFNGLSSLNDLYFNSDLLQTIEAGAFNGLSSLRDLDLGRTQLSTLRQDVFTGLLSLEELDLDDNPLQTIEAGAFSGLDSLIYLNLSDVQLQTIEAGAFSGLDSLVRLNLNSAQLSTLQRDVFSGLSSLDNLDLEENPLQTIEAGAFNGLSNLTRLNLYNTQLSTLQRDVFSGLSSLDNLDLEESTLRAIEVGAFNGLSNLISLDLEGNRLTTLPVGIFSGLSRLERLDLRNNPGAPFTLTLELARTDNTNSEAAGPATVKVKLAEGAPFDMSIRLSVEGGTLSADIATLTAGQIESNPITVTQTGTDLATVRLGVVPTIPQGYRGIEIAVGIPLVLFSEQLNRSPVAVGTILAQSLTVGDAATVVNVFDKFNDADGDTLHYTASSDNTSVVSVSMSGTQVTLVPEGVGDATVTVTASDSALTAMQTFSVSVMETKAPDLRVESVRVDKNTVAPGEKFQLSAVVENRGKTDASAITVGYYQSTDDTISDTDMQRNISTLARIAGEAKAEPSIELTAPDIPGIYYYGVCVDAVVHESDTNNNCSTAVMLTVGGADLIVESVRANKTAVKPGENFRIIAAVHNQGGVSSTPTVIRYYLSTDDTISTADTLLTTRDITSQLGAGATTNQSGLQLTAPDVPGVYYYGACVDAIAYESDTNNNCSEAIAITVEGADLRIDGTPQVSKTTLSPGETFQMDTRVWNQGRATSDATTLRYYLSIDDTILPEDTEVDSERVAALSPKGAHASRRRADISKTLTAPDTPGVHYYGVCVDVVSGDADITNNCSQAIAITVEAPPPEPVVSQVTGEPGNLETVEIQGPDLIISAVRVDASTIKIGGGVRFHITLTNQGTSKAPATMIRYYRSDDATISAEDTELRAVPVGELGADRSYTTWALLPSAFSVGTYYYGACLDGVTAEFDTSNNCSEAVEIIMVLQSDPVEGLEPRGRIPPQTLKIGDSPEPMSVSLYFAGKVETWEVTSSKPTVVVVSIEAGTDVVTLAPVSEGHSVVTVTAHHGDLTAKQTFDVYVGIDPTRVLRWKTSIPPQPLSVGGSPLVLDVSSHVENEVERWRAVSSHPRIVVVSMSGSSVTLTPVSEGNAEVTIYASGGTTEVEHTFGVFVGASGAPDLKWVIPVPPQTLVVGDSPLVLDVSGHVAGEVETWQASSSNEAAVTVSMSGSAVTLTPVSEGSANVTISARRGDLEVSGTFTVSVGADDDLRWGVPVPPQTLEEWGSPVVLDVSGHVVGEVETWQASSSNEAAVSVSMSGSVVTLTPVSVGSSDVTISARRGDLEISNTFTVSVAPDTSPTVSIPDANLRAAVRSALGLAEGDTLTQQAMARLTELDIPSPPISDLTGLEYATRLTRLSLTDNYEFTDITPLQNLTNLTELYLNDNRISNITPLQNLTKLTRLNLSRNQITDISPLANLTNLTYLYVTQNQFSDISALRNLTSLTELSLHKNQISDITPLANLTNLTKLALDQNENISNITPLAGMTSLTYLQLEHNQIVNITPLTNLTALTTLWLRENQIVDITPLAGLTSLTYLMLGNNQIVNITPLTNLTALTTLILYSNQIVDITPLANLTALIDLRLQYNQISNATPLEGLTSLRWLKLADNPIEDVAPLLRLKEKNPNVRISGVNLNNAPTIPSAPVLPHETALLSNYPNPFNPETWIPYQLAKAADVTVTIYNLRGVVVRQLALGYRPPGFYYSRGRAAHWDGRNALGEKVASGLYFYTFTAGDFTATQKLLIRK